MVLKVCRVYYTLQMTLFILLGIENVYCVNSRVKLLNIECLIFATKILNEQFG